MFPKTANPRKKEKLEVVMSDDRVEGVSFIFMPVIVVVKRYTILSRPNVIKTIYETT